MSPTDEGVALFMGGKIAESLVKFREALREQPLNPLYVYNMGRTLDELENDLAEEFYHLAHALGNVDATFQLGLWNQQRGNPAEALRFYREFLKKADVDDAFFPAAKGAVERMMPTIVWRKTA